MWMINCEINGRLVSYAFVDFLWKQVMNVIVQLYDTDIKWL